MSGKLNVAYYVTGHGLGHATRVIEISHFLLRLGHKVTINTAAPLAFFQQQLPYDGLTMRCRLLDSGAFQHDAFTVDMKRSLEEYKQVAQDNRNELLSAETQWLEENNMDLVVSDVVPLACAAAHKASIPAVVVTNFTWDFIYSDYLSQVGVGFRALIWQIAEDYAKADLCLRLPGHCPMPAFREILDVPLVAREARKSSNQVRMELGIDAGQKVVLLMYGGQPAGDWIMKSESLPQGWVCVVCSNGKLPGGRPLPANFMLADKDTYTPDLVNAADCVLGKIGYGTVSEALVHGTPFVFTRRDYFNEEPFLRKLLEQNGLAVEMSRRDFLEGNWKAFISRAATLQSRFKKEQNGSEVVAELLVEVALEKQAEKSASPRLRTSKSLALQRTATSLGTTRLKDAVVYGYIMQRHARQENVEVPEWYADQLSCDSQTKAEPSTTLRSLPPNVEVVNDNKQALAENEDTQQFVEKLASLANSQRRINDEISEVRAARGLFTAQDEIHVTRAPGRLDVMGGIADYSGSLVLEMPIAQACHVAAQRHTAGESVTLWRHIQERHEALNRNGWPVIRVVSLGADKTNRGPTFDVDLCDLLPDGKPLPYQAAREMFKKDPSRMWVAYVIGALLVLMHEVGAEIKEGLSLLIDSAVPDGKGVSSSAALEVACMTAIASVYGIKLDPAQTASLCQKIENLVVGAPCGVMDQMAVTLGRKDTLMALKCQPAQILPSCVIPTDIKFWGVDSGVRHSVGGNDYGSVRTAAFMGLKIISVLADKQRQKLKQVVNGASPRTSTQEHDASQQARWTSSAEAHRQDASARHYDSLAKAGDGYLTNIPPSLFRQFFEPELPETMLGSDFLAEYGDHWDTATEIQADAQYPVAQATQHAIQENFRVHAFRAVMSSQEPDFPSLLAEIMYQSHASYSRCGLGSDATDRLVNLARQHAAAALSTGTTPAIFGAKITGGGSGGTVCFIGRNDANGEAALAQITEQYSKETGGFAPFVFQGSSMGAADFGVLQIKLQVLQPTLSSIEA